MLIAFWSHSAFILCFCAWLTWCALSFLYHYLDKFIGKFDFYFFKKPSLITIYWDKMCLYLDIQFLPYCVYFSLTRSKRNWLLFLCLHFINGKMFENKFTASRILISRWTFMWWSFPHVFPQGHFHTFSYIWWQYPYLIIPIFFKKK